MQSCTKPLILTISQYWWRQWLGTGKGPLPKPLSPKTSNALWLWLQIYYCMYLGINDTTILLWITVLTASTSEQEIWNYLSKSRRNVVASSRRFSIQHRHTANQELSQYHLCFQCCHWSLSLRQPAVQPVIAKLASWELSVFSAAQQKIKQFWYNVCFIIYRNLIQKRLTHWGRVTHICVSKLTIIGSENGLAPGRRQAIIWTNAGMLLIGPLGTNFNETSIKIHTFSLKKIHLKLSSGKWRPFCLGLDVLNATSVFIGYF